MAAYDDLLQLARRRLSRERSGHMLQPTDLVHEAYCRLRQQRSASPWNGRDHLLAVASEAMRRILVEHARRKLAGKRGGGRAPQSLKNIAVSLPMDAYVMLAVHEALDRLAEEHPLAAELVKLRIFNGCSHLDVAAELDLTRGQADRLWAFAKTRLYVLMKN